MEVIDSSFESDLHYKEDLLAVVSVCDVGLVVPYLAEIKEVRKHEVLFRSVELKAALFVNRSPDNRYSTIRQTDCNAATLVLNQGQFVRCFVNENVLSADSKSLREHLFS